MIHLFEATDTRVDWSLCPFSLPWPLEWKVEQRVWLTDCGLQVDQKWGQFWDRFISVTPLISSHLGHWWEEGTPPSCREALQPRGALGWLLCCPDNVQLVCTDQQSRAPNWWCIFIAVLSSENPQLTLPPPSAEALAPTLRETPSNKEIQQAAAVYFGWLQTGLQWFQAHCCVSLGDWHVSRGYVCVCGGHRVGTCMHSV